MDPSNYDTGYEQGYEAGWSDARETALTQRVAADEELRRKIISLNLTLTHLEDELEVAKNNVLASPWYSRES